jgi:class 3 adenylate cyclase
VDVAAWLSELGLGRYAAAFRDHHIDAPLLPTLTAEELRELGVISLGHRKRLLAAIAGLSARSEPQGVSAAPPQAERRQLTVMFVDLVGSTALSGRLDPEDMRELLHAYRNTVTGEIARVGGHVAKLMGDGVLAYFGWPLAHEDDAERAVRAGLALTAAVARLPPPVGEPSLACRIGIATGLVVVGDLVGEGVAREEAVLGQTPNLAARLQGLAESGQVAIAESTRLLLGEVFELADLGTKSVAPPSCRWSAATRSWRFCWGAGRWPKPVRARACCWWATPASASRASLGRCWTPSPGSRTPASAASAHPTTATARCGR